MLNHNSYPCEILNVPQMLTCTCLPVFVFEYAVTLNRSALVERIEIHRELQLEYLPCIVPLSPDCSLLIV